MDFYYTSISEQAIENAVACLQLTFLNKDRLIKKTKQTNCRNFSLLNPFTFSHDISIYHLDTGLATANVGADNKAILSIDAFITRWPAVLIQTTKIFSHISKLTLKISVLFTIFSNL